MLEAKLLSLSVAGVLVVSAIAYAILHRKDVGNARFFANQPYHFQTLRAMNDVASDGADTAEVLETIKQIRAGDAQGWFRAWSDRADRVALLAAATTDRIAKGRALLRAHNYYRTAEFFFRPMTPSGRCRRPRTFNPSTPASIRWVSSINGSGCPMVKAITSKRCITQLPKALLESR
jgi:hypothetical protein